MSIFTIIVGVIVLFWLLSRGFARSSGSRNLELDDVRYFVRLIAKVAKSDGVVSKDEAYYIALVLDDICEKMGDKSVRYELKELYSIEKDSQNSAFNIAREYRSRLRLSEKTCINRTIFFLNLAYIDGLFNEDERRILREICDGFGIRRDVQDEIFREFEAEFYASFNEKEEEKFDPYEILEVSRDASFDEIKKSYRRLAREHHPDVLMGQGEQIVSEGTKKMQQITEAYAILKAKFKK